MGLAEMGTFDKMMEQDMPKKQDTIDDHDKFVKGLKLKSTVDDAASKPLTYDDLVKMHEKAKADLLWPPDLVKLPLHEAVKVAQKAKKDKELFDKMNEVTAKVTSQYPYSGTWTPSSTPLPYQYKVDYVSSKPEEDNMEIEISGFNKMAGGKAEATVTIKGPTMGTEAKQQVAAMIADKVASGVADYVIKEHLQEIVAMVDFKAVSNLVLSKVLLSSGLADKNLIEMLLTPKVEAIKDMSIEMAMVEFLEKGPGKSWTMASAGYAHLEQFVSWVSNKMANQASTKK